MAREIVPETAIERLVRYLFDAPGAGVAAGADPLATELTAWLTASPRFRTFAEAQRDKIRKKLRGAADSEARRDVRAELRTAHFLLSERRIELAFEAYGSGKPGPDFTVSFRGEGSFNLEVTRMRRNPDVASYGWALLAKLRQLPPSAPNAVVLATDSDGADAVDVDAATRALRARADRKDEEFFVGRGFDGTRGFYERFLRLGAVFVLGEAASGEGRASLWLNRSARIALPVGPRGLACSLSGRSSKARAEHRCRPIESPSGPRFSG
jgi:hypothetical protein